MKQVLVKAVVKAREFARAKHNKQLDDMGKSYFDAHIEQVVRVLQQVTNDEVMLAVGYLHDTIEDTDTTYQELLSEFGKDIANLVMELTHDGQKDNKGYYFPRLVSKRAIVIKFADRISNLSRMESWNDKRQTQYLGKSKFWASDTLKPEILSNLSSLKGRYG